MYKFIKLLQNTGDCPTVLVENEDGVRYVQKLLDERQLGIYEKLISLNISGIPKSRIAPLDEMLLPDVMNEMRSELLADSAGVLVEEYIGGSDLEKLSESGHKMSRREFQRMMLSLCRTLSKVHKAGIVHRDIKPANIIRSDSGRYYIIDFGNARIPAESSTHTRIVATLGYASPEQLEGKQATPQSDIYSLGRTMKEFMPKSRSLTRIYKKATMDSPNDRYRTAAHMALAIRFTPLALTVRAAIAAVLAFLIFLLIIPSVGDGRTITKNYDSAMDSEQIADEEQRLLNEIAVGNDGYANFMRLSELYEMHGEHDKAADILIEYVDTVNDRRLYVSTSPIYERLEELKPKTSVDEQAKILELNGNADYIDRLFEAGEYAHAREVLDDITANPCKELERMGIRQTDEYYKRLEELENGEDDR